MDPLGLFRDAVLAQKLPTPTTTSDPSAAASQPPSELAEATHIYFTVPTPQCLPVESETRFTQGSGDAVDLRSIYLAYLCKEDAPQDYLAKYTDLNSKLPEGKQARHLNFVEKLELVSWLEGADSSDYVKAPAPTQAADAAVPVVPGTGAAVTQTSVNGRPVKVIDARLQAIYNGERKMGDRNTVLRGVKPTVSPSSHQPSTPILTPKTRTSPTSANTKTSSSPNAAKTPPNPAASPCAPSRPPLPNPP